MSKERFLIYHAESECWFEIYGEEELRETLDSEPLCSEVTGIPEHEAKFLEYQSQKQTKEPVVDSQMATDLKEALDLLSCAGPNPMLVNESEYWDRYEKLTSRYTEKENDDGE
ncbi:hypothetical protein [Bdellovibrio sp. BCCA]|uniref:hypothetical protein n=1 Tax=Bdellovibrio sp. BCCA TaxID=3136281 RepID=UPI0030F30BA2